MDFFDDYERIKKLFEKLEIFTLEDIDIVLEFVDKYNIENSVRAYRDVYNKKYNESSDNGDFDGRNEYISPYFSFDITNIKNDIHLLNKEELNYFECLLGDALNNIPNEIRFQRVYERTKNALDIINIYNEDKKLIKK